MADQIHVPPGGPPQGPGPSRELYGRMGEDAIFRMCRDFYARLEPVSYTHLTLPTNREV